MKTDFCYIKANQENVPEIKSILEKFNIKYSEHHRNVYFSDRMKYVLLTWDEEKNLIEIEFLTKILYKKFQKMGGNSVSDIELDKFEEFMNNRRGKIVMNILNLL